jgi:rhodanese-related sulfurtransferase
MHRSLSEKLWSIAVWAVVVFFIVNLLAMIGSVVVNSFGTRWFNTWLPAGFTPQWYTMAWDEFHLPDILLVMAEVVGAVVLLSGLIGVPTQSAYCAANVSSCIAETTVSRPCHSSASPATRCPRRARPGSPIARRFGSAARTYWTLKYAGVKDVSILDGGVAAWQQAGLPLESGVKAPSPKIFTATIDKSILAEATDVETIEEKGGTTLVDARPASFFFGKEKAPASQAYGHIPGALNVDSAGFYDPKTNRLKPKAELAAIASAVPAGPAVSYCNTGHWAATDWFVLHDVLGRKETRLYAGSMVEWTSNANRPIESSRTKWDDLKKALGLGS